MVMLYFVDSTNEKWVQNVNIVMELADVRNGHVHYNMKKQDDFS